MFRAIWAIPAVVFAMGGGLSGQEEQLPSFDMVRGIVEPHFSAQRDYRSGDIISKRDVQPLFSQLESLGWKVSDQEEILSEMLDGGSPVVQTLRTRAGRKFMRKVSGYRLIYDRLDRISREPGGRRLVADLVKLPDGERYAKMVPRRGAPGMLEFLPKSGSGKRRRITDYKKPTGRIYTAGGFLERLEKSYAKAVRESREQ